MGVYFVDKGYIEIALYPWFERELLVLGCSRGLRGLRGHYILPSSNNLIGIDLVFEEKAEGIWGITHENGAALGLWELETRDPDGFFHDETLFYFLRFENERRGRGEDLDWRSRLGM